MYKSVAAYRAQDLKEDAEKCLVKLKFRKGKSAWSNMVFKEVYKDEYTLEEMGQLQQERHQ